PHLSPVTSPPDTRRVRGSRYPAARKGWPCLPAPRTVLPKAGIPAIYGWMTPLKTHAFPLSQHLRFRHHRRVFPFIQRGQLVRLVRFKDLPDLRGMPCPGLLRQECPYLGKGIFLCRLCRSFCCLFFCSGENLRHLIGDVHQAFPALL